MSIKVNSITKIFGTQKALDNVSFEVKAGEVVGFLGPNGAGKSTMMKIITCFIPQNSGAVSVCGFDIIDEPIEVRRKVGYLPENNPLYYDMYVKEHLFFTGGIFKIKNIKNRVDEIIEITGLEVEQKKKIGALSKGYKQRVGLAQALIHNPEVLILDEPTSGLDPNQIIEIRNLIKKIGKEKTVLLSTHIMQEVEAICDKAIIINKGIIVANDSTANLHKISSNKNIVTVEFDIAVDVNLLKNIPQVTTVKNIKDNIWEIHSAEANDIRPTIFQFAVKNNLTVLSMKKEEQSIEEVFQKLTM
ncbi:MAG: gliding motility-associated ABC transporter ATP-binding subunit GldA [Bacteroidales bacterium]|jgi:ABC-2 type transport system ATP-binding protein